jgi:predicted HTH transcriptional regulator
MTPEFARLLSQAYQGGVDTSLRELVSALNLSVDDVLGSCIEAGGVLQSMGLALTPDITKGDFDLRRALSSSVRTSEQRVRELLADDECRDIEFKSSLICDLRAYREEPARHARSDGVTHSALKSVCAFANSGGGTLIIGVEDDRSICGLAPDYEVTGFDRDRWENHFRNLIATKFWQGRLVNSFVHVEFFITGDHEIALVEVVGRTETTFLQHARENRNEFYVRQGNRTVSLDIHEFETWIRRKR